MDYQSDREPPQRRGAQLAGRTAGIIGYGSIGSYLADLLVGIGMTVLVTDPYAEIEEDGVDALTAADLAKIRSATFDPPVLPLSKAMRPPKETGSASRDGPHDACFWNDDRATLQSTACAFGKSCKQRERVNAARVQTLEELFLAKYPEQGRDRPPPDCPF